MRFSPNNDARGCYLTIFSTLERTFSIHWGNKIELKLDFQQDELYRKFTVEKNALLPYLNYLVTRGQAERSTHSEPSMPPRICSGFPNCEFG